LVGVFVFRADASRQLGYGHVMRCLALADALRARGSVCLFVFGQGGDVLADEVAIRGHLALTLPLVADEAADAAATCAVVATTELPCALRGVVLDHYGLGPAWETAIRGNGTRLLVIDDLLRSHDCEFLLDPNVIGAENPYRDLVSADCHCFLGPHYAPLRPEFARLREIAPIRQKLARILIFFGGSDPTDETGKALRGVLAACDSLEVDVAIGFANPNRAALDALVDQSPKTVRLHVQTPRMADLILAADLAIGAGGSASWERCSLKLPTIISVLADNQAALAERLEAAGAAVNLGNASCLAPEDYTAAVRAMDNSRLAALSTMAASLTDGLGAGRLAEKLDTRS